MANCNNHGSGIIRRVDDLGRIVLPKDIRRQLQVFEGDPMEIELVAGGVMLRKYCPEAKVRDQLRLLDSIIEDENSLSMEEIQQLREHVTRMLLILDKK